MPVSPPFLLDMNGNDDTEKEWTNSAWCACPVTEHEAMSAAVQEEDHDAGADEEEDQRQHATAMRSRQRRNSGTRRIILDSRSMRKGLARGAVNRRAQGAVATSR